MQYYRCKCGKHESIGSMPPSRCHGCEDCGTNLALGPEQHIPPYEHEFTSTIEQRSNEGPIDVKVCCYCYRTPWEIEKGIR